jgi:hypothetical protein
MEVVVVENTMAAFERVTLVEVPNKVCIMDYHLFLI